ncbi:MAG: hypothetical protein E7360_06655 [Clostridiales bacterium]|nr:hypothetical protein [Clostridiales bacterium]
MKRTLTGFFSFVFILALIGSIIFMLPFGVKPVKAAEASGNVSVSNYLTENIVNHVTFKEVVKFKLSLPDITGGTYFGSYTIKWFVPTAYYNEDCEYGAVIFLKYTLENENITDNFYYQREIYGNRFVMTNFHEGEQNGGYVIGIDDHVYYNSREWSLGLHRDENTEMAYVLYVKDSSGYITYGKTEVFSLNGGHYSESIGINDRTPSDILGRTYGLDVLSDTSNWKPSIAWDNGDVLSGDTVFRFYYNKINDKYLSTWTTPKCLLYVGADHVTMQTHSIQYNGLVSYLLDANVNENYVDFLIPAELIEDCGVGFEFSILQPNGTYSLVSEDVICKIVAPSTTEEPKNPGTEDPGTEDPGTEDPKKENPKEEPQEFNLAFPLAGFAIVLVLGAVIFKKR